MTTSKLDDNESTVDSSANVDRFGSNKKLSKSQKFTILGNNGATKKPKFLTFNTKKIFNLLRQAFTKAPILWHFYPEYHIRIETNISDYAIESVLSQLTSDQLILNVDQTLTKSDFGQWYPIAYFSN